MNKEYRIEFLKKREEAKKKRLELLYQELFDRCKKSNYYKFEYACEFYDSLWHTWSIDINGKKEAFALKDISTIDFDHLIQLGLIESIKEYSTEELVREEDLRIRYKILSRS